MNVHKGRRYVVTFSSIFLLSACTQEEETEQRTVAEAPNTVQIEAGTLSSIIGDDSEDSMEQRTLGSDVSKEPQPSSSKFSVDIEKRRTELLSRFSNADQNGDGLLELHELEEKKKGTTQPRLSYWMKDFDQPQYSTATLERFRLELERTGKAPEQLRNIQNVMKQRFDNEFDTADTNGDSRLSRDEYHNRVRRFEAQEKQQYFSQLDTNQDDFVDWREYSIDIQDYEANDENQDGFVSLDELRAGWRSQ